MLPQNLLTLAGLLVCGSSFLSAASEAKSLPPIIFLTVDDMNWDSVGVFGSRVENPTPNIDKLAGESVRFQHAYVQVAVCTPSRHAMLSGCHSHVTSTEGFVDIKPVAPTIPQILQENGYYTAIINKGVAKYGWDMQADRKETNQGRDPEIYAQLVRKAYTNAKEQGKPLFIMANTMDPHRPFHDSDEQAQWAEISKIIPQLKKASRIYRPDEVYVPSNLPDLPPIRKEMAEYYSSVRRADDVVGAIVRTLEELGISDEALILFISDHGISMPFAKANVYRESLRVPLLVRLPHKSEGGRIVAEKLVSAVDLAPTILDVIDLPIPAKMQGHSFKELITESAPKDHSAWNYTYGYYYQDTNPGRTPMFTVQDLRFGYIVNLFYGTGKRVETSDYGNGSTWQTMLKEAKVNPEIDARVNFYRTRALEELYDYEADPYALNNLIDDPAYAEVRARLTANLEQWMINTGCYAQDAFTHRYDLVARKAYVKLEDEKSFERGGGKNARPVTYNAEAFDGKVATWTLSENSGVFAVQPVDGKTAVIDVNGNKALKGLKKNKDQEGVFVYFHVHDGLTETDRVSYPMKVRVTLYDKTPGEVLVQYNSANSSYTDSRPQKITGAGSKLTLEFDLERARFDNSQHGGADLRVTGKDGAELLIEKIEVERAF
jgi:N-sulfoglucosamine sulfohydrolase